MKTRRITITAFALVTAFAMSGSAQLKNASGTGATTTKWVGQGTASAPDGTPQGNYQVSVVVNSSASGDSDSVATITLPSGKIETITQKITKNANGSYSIVSSLGKGGGACYGNGLCEFYIEEASTGKAVAITCVRDADGSMRDLITVLQNGKAVSILSEKLVQVK